MNIAKLGSVIALLGLVLTSTAFGQLETSPELHQPTLVRQAALEYDNYLYFAPSPGDGTASESPSDRPVAPPAAEAPPLEAPSIPPQSPATGCGGGCGSSCGSVCCTDCCVAEPCRLFDCCWLNCKGIEVGGWIDQGITLNAANPNNRFNGPVTFNDRSNEYQLNQLWMYAERATCTGGYGIDVGGRFDVVYGTDHRFTVANGLEDNWNLGQRFYGLALPQCYVDVAYNDLTVRMGHFFTIIGYEVVQAPENFFYSHSYTKQYGEPFTHTGALAMYNLDNCWSVSSGIHRGWNNWEDNNDDLSFLGGATWTSCDKSTSLAFALTTGNEDNAAVNNRTMYSIVLTKQLGCRWQWVLQHDQGWDENAAAGRGDAEWYGFVNYLYYQINPCWAAGVRYEWFADDDGVRVDDTNAAGGPPKGMALNGVASHWNELTLGLKYTPNPNVILRTELRWDWVDPLVDTGQGVGSGPYDDFERRSQLLWGTDLIVLF